MFLLLLRSSPHLSLPDEETLVLELTNVEMGILFMVLNAKHPMRVRHARCLSPAAAHAPAAQHLS